MNDAGLAKELAGRGLDVTVPNVARIYDYFLGGKDNFAADREAAEELRSLLPDAEMACRENRDFLRRAVRYLATDSGIGQFIDIGSGLPTTSNTHEVAQAIRPDARVAYVDYDPVVAAHGRALLGSSPGVAVIEADLRRPGVIMGSQPLTDLVDFSAPVAILLTAVLHFIPDNDDPYGIVDVLKSVMVAGSYLVVSHATQDSVSREEALGGMSIYDKSSAPVVPRSYGGVLKFFDRMDLVDPGLVSISEWRSSQRHSSRSVRGLMYGGVARKP
jgi:hypothetical protein